MRKVLFLLLIPILLFSQKENFSYTISGYITDSSSGETIVGGRLF